MQRARQIFTLYEPGLNLPKTNPMLADTDAIADAVAGVAPYPMYKTPQGLPQTIDSKILSAQ